MTGSQVMFSLINPAVTRSLTGLHAWCFIRAMYADVSWDWFLGQYNNLPDTVYLANPQVRCGGIRRSSASPPPPFATVLLRPRLAIAQADARPAMPIFFRHNST